MSQNPHSRSPREKQAESVPFFHATHHIAEPRVGHRCSRRHTGGPHVGSRHALASRNRNTLCQECRWITKNKFKKSNQPDRRLKKLQNGKLASIQFQSKFLFSFAFVEELDACQFAWPMTQRLKKWTLFRSSPNAKITPRIPGPFN